MSQQPQLILQTWPALTPLGSPTARRTMNDATSNPADDQSPAELPTRPFTLVLISHSHAPPLLPEPHSKYDLRKTSNPPKHIRDAYDGRFQRLREHMLSSDEFCTLLDTAQARIEKQMASITENHAEGSGKHTLTPRSRLRWFRLDIVARSLL